MYEDLQLPESSKNQGIPEGIPSLASPATMSSGTPQPVPEVDELVWDELDPFGHEPVTEPTEQLRQVPRLVSVAETTSLPVVLA